MLALSRAFIENKMIIYEKNLYHFLQRPYGFLIGC